MSSNKVLLRSLTTPRDETRVLRTFQSEQVTFEIMLGRALAVCVHPFAAWTLLSTSWRMLILTAFAAEGYVIVFGARLMFNFA